MSRRVRIVAAAVAGLYASAAEGGIFTTENADRLCRAQHEGVAAVDPDLLAAAIVEQARIPFDLLDLANATGTSDGTIRMHSLPDGTLGEPGYAVVNAGAVSPPDANRPFGPDVDLASRKDARTARESIARIVTDDLQRSADRGSVRASDRLTYRFRSIPSGVPISSDPSAFFGPNRTVVILCERSATAPGSNPSSGGRGGGNETRSVTITPRLRGTVAALAAAPASLAELRSVEPAKISMERNEVADTTTFGVTAVAGLAINSSSGLFSVIPFLSYDRRSVTGGANNIEKFSTGLVGSLRLEGASSALHASLETSFVDNLQRDSRQGKLRLYLEPAFALGNGNGVLFGSYLRPIGPLELRPDFTGIIDVSRVFRRGTDPSLQNAQSYAGFGGQLELRARIRGASVFSDLEFVIARRQLFMTGIDDHRIGRWFGSIEYASKDFPYVGIRFSFTSGQNDDTFQREETYQVGLALRY
jgi:hypothetical protein